MLYFFFLKLVEDPPSLHYEELKVTVAKREKTRKTKARINKTEAKERSQNNFCLPWPSEDTIHEVSL
jgi:hypothetical protein